MEGWTGSTEVPWTSVRAEGAWVACSEGHNHQGDAATILRGSIGSVQPACPPAIHQALCDGNPGKSATRSQWAQQQEAWQAILSKVRALNTGLLWRSSVGEHEALMIPNLKVQVYTVCLMGWRHVAGTGIPLKPRSGSSLSFVGYTHFQEEGWSEWERMKVQGGASGSSGAYWLWAGSESTGRGSRSQLTRKEGPGARQGAGRKQTQ